MVLVALRTAQEGPVKPPTQLHAVSASLHVPPFRQKTCGASAKAGPSGTGMMACVWMLALPAFARHQCKQPVWLQSSVVTVTPRHVRHHQSLFTSYSSPHLESVQHLPGARKRRRRHSGRPPRNAAPRNLCQWNGMESADLDTTFRQPAQGEPRSESLFTQLI